MSRLWELCSPDGRVILQRHDTVVFDTNIFFPRRRWKIFPVTRVKPSARSYYSRMKAKREAAEHEQ
jgi:hypothetical protein